MKYLPLLLVVACANQEKALEHAREYAMTNFPDAEVLNLQCEQWDSDGNGRVRCNVSLREAGRTHVEQVECPSSYIPQLERYCVGLKR